MIFLLSIFVLMLIGGYVLFITLKGKGELDLGFTQPRCPNCGFEVPVEGDHQNHRKSGFTLSWTCPVCNQTTDAWGRITANKRPRPLPEPDESSRPIDFGKLHDEHGKTPVERLLEDEEESNEHKL